MSNVKRYAQMPFKPGYEPTLFETPNGHLVKFEDYQKIESNAAQDAKLIFEKLQSALRERDNLRDTLAELRTLVKGECPSLLNEDSGGSSRLDSKIDQILSVTKLEIKP